MKTKQSIKSLEDKDRIIFIESKELLPKGYSEKLTSLPTEKLQLVIFLNDKSMTKLHFNT